MRPVISFALLVLALAGCIDDEDADAAFTATTTDIGLPEPAEVYRREFDFDPPRDGDVHDPFTMPQGSRVVTLSVAWSTPSPVGLGAVQVQLEDETGDAVAECRVDLGTQPRACTQSLDDPPAGEWSVEYEGGAAGMRAEVVVSVTLDLLDASEPSSLEAR